MTQGNYDLGSPARGTLLREFLRLQREHSEMTCDDLAVMAFNSPGRVVLVAEQLVEHHILDLALTAAVAEDLAQRQARDQLN